MALLTGKGFGQTSPPMPPALPTTAPSPAPQPSAATNPFSYRGYLRVYDFTRQNASTGIGGAGQTNQQTIEPGISLHGDLQLNNSNFTVGGSYFYTTPFNGCADPRSHLTPPCGLKRPPALNPDDTLPGFALSTFYEA